ncbi:MAG: hypothetical protein V1733_00880 [bacterium]
MSKLVSFLLHPLLVPTYMLLFLLGIDGMYTLILNWQLKLLLVGTVVTTTLILPLFVIFLIFRIKLISSLSLPQREERIFPLITIAIFYTLTFYLLKNLFLPQFFQIFILGATVTAIISLIINLFYRISLHMIAWGGVSGICLGILFLSGEEGFVPLILSILLSGIAGTARMKVNAHQPLEIYSGWLAGVSVMSLSCLLF